MNLIEGQNVDLISPFPPQEVRRVFGWNHCYRTLTENDDTPNTIDDFERHMQALLSVCPSWGIIDKNHITNIKHEAPLVGIGLFEPAGIRHGFFHVATARKAFKTGLIDEAGQLVIKYLFDSIPTLLRVGAYMDERNAPAKSLCKRMGFRFEGICEDMILRNGEPKNIAYFGLTRRRWNDLCLSQTSIPNNLTASSGTPLETLTELVPTEQDSLPLEETPVPAMQE